MNQQKRLFWRKVMYFAAIAVLLFPLFVLSQPESGLLAQMRTKHNLSQANLGQIDPTSVSMKLATFGMQGAAANLLWARANEYKDREDYTNFRATLEQITYLQPHFYKVWDFQGHNVAFNISVEFDDYRDRYRHVTEGLDLLRKGISYNQNELRLLRRLAFYIGLKMGRSDEKEFFRPMFMIDMDYHAPPRDQNWLINTPYEHRPEKLTDNWLLSKWWYEQVEERISSGASSYGKMSAFLVHSDVPMQQMQYAEALEKEGRFEAADEAWKQASQEWFAYGMLQIPTSSGDKVRLEDLEKDRQARDEAFDKLEALAPGLREELVQQRFDALPPVLQAALETPAKQRTPEQQSFARDAQLRTRVMPADVAEAMPEELRTKALNLVERFHRYDKKLQLIIKYRDNTVNYTYWKNRCQTEQTSDLIEARKSIYKARKAYDVADLPTSIAQYERGFELWRRGLDANPTLLDQQTMVQDLIDTIEDYLDVLAQLREDGSRDYPDNFILSDVVNRWRAIQKIGG